MKIFLTLLFVTFFSLGIMAKGLSFDEKKIEYSDGKNIFEGMIFTPKKIKGIKSYPGMILFHNWIGVSEETISKARDYAKLGIIVFVADIYGKGIRPKDAKEAGALATLYKNNRQLLRDRAELAYNQLLKIKVLDIHHIIASGYCFGGTTALELARSGLPLKMVFSFHGGLSNPQPDDAKNIRAKTYIFHGAIDPYVPKEEVDAFYREMNQAQVPYEFIAYSNAVHSFTDKTAGSDVAKGAAYNQDADQSSFLYAKNLIQSLQK